MPTVQETLAEINRLAALLDQQRKTAPVDSYTKEELGGLIDSTKKVTAEAQKATTNVATQQAGGKTTQQILSQSVQNAPNTSAVGVTAPTPTTPKVTLPTNQSASDRASGFLGLSGALEKAVQLGRAQRQSAELDFLGGVIPKGAVSASQFTGLLANLNRASNNYTEPLTKSVLDFAQTEQKNQIDSQNQIRELALSAIDAGATAESVKAITAAPDIDSAINIAASVLSGKGTKGAEIKQVGSNLVSVTPEGVVSVLYSAPTSGGGSSSGGTTNTGVFNSGAVRVSDQEIGQLAMELEQTRGADGHANTQLYVDAFNAWVGKGGLPQDFFKNYDPDYYLNPADGSIPPQIRSQMKQTETQSNPFR